MQMMLYHHHQPFHAKAAPLTGIKRPICRTRRRCQAAHGPCVLITSTDERECSSVRHLAAEVRKALGVEVLVVLPSPLSHDSAACSSGSNTPASAHFTVEQEMQLQQPVQDELTFTLSGATAADCVLCAVDQSCGLMQSLCLSPVMVLVGVARNPALSSDMEQHPEVAVARQAAILGLPAVAVCLATTSASAPVQPAVTATVHLLSKLMPVLQSTSGSQGTVKSARNFPRAHFPFPEEGRWALGTQLPLPQRHSGTTSSSGWTNYDSWALGDDNSWLGHYNHSSSRQQQHQAGEDDSALARQRAYSALQAAFADGDVLLCLNVPPTWNSSAGFAATRPGVLWHCWQVSAQQPHWQPQRLQQMAASASISSSAAAAGARWSHLYSTGSSDSSCSRSWNVDSEDIYGRTLPSTQYSSGIPTGSNFVAQDNTRKVAADIKSTQDTCPEAEQQLQQRRPLGTRGAAALPCSFRVQKGTLLNDAAACGDVEAVFGGQAAVTVCQTWPAGHPLSCVDELLLAALDEGNGGVPAWLVGIS